MADFDVMVTWRKADDSTVDLPATVCFHGDRDDLSRRMEVIGAAIEANLVDFPDDIDPDDCVPVVVRISNASD